MLKTRYAVHLVCILLAVITFIAYEPILHNSFISFDDDIYIYKNPHVTTGLKMENIIWAFTNIHANNYHPLTSISHMLDCQLFRLAPAGHHFTNLVFHMANTALLFFVFSKMTKRIWSSAFVAALFALHPLHVESVAWASERKDVLCTFFWLLTMFAYWHYTQSRSKSYYALSIGLFILGLLSKPMIVTLPFVLLLMDYWPLNRFKTVKIRKLILEKIPFILLSFVLSVITLIVQGRMGIIKPIVRYPLAWRLENTIISYLTYVEKLFWPFNLAIFYPHPKGTTPLIEVIISALILIAITIFVILQIRKRPYLAFGWFWFLGTLVPVIGLCQVGMQAWANRYTYIPYTGLFIALTWGITDYLANWNSRKVFCSVSAGVILFALGVKTYIQTIYWHDNLTVYSHAIDAVKDNWWAYSFLGTELGLRGDYDDASKMLEKSLDIYPENASAYYELAKISLYKSDWKQAIKMYEKLLPPLPDDINAPRNVDANTFEYPMLRNLYLNSNVNMAIALTEVGRYDEAQKRYKEALRFEPNLPAAVKGLKDIRERIEKGIKQQDANSTDLNTKGKK